MWQHLRPAIVILALMTVLTGLVYPLAVTGLAQAVFPRQANGSLIERGGCVRGSSLIGQPFDEPRYFWGRLSATAPPYNAAASCGSNRGPLDPDLAAAARARIEALRKADPANATPIPADLVTSSASGLDGDISVAAALYQVPRVARARGLDQARVLDLVLRNVRGRQFGLLGEERVNVLELNLALDGIE